MMPTLSPAMGAHGEKIQWEGVPLRCVVAVMVCYG